MLQFVNIDPNSITGSPQTLTPEKAAGIIALNLFNANKQASDLVLTIYPQVTLDSWGIDAFTINSNTLNLQDINSIIKIAQNSLPFIATPAFAA